MFYLTNQISSWKAKMSTYFWPNRPIFDLTYRNEDNNWIERRETRLLSNLWMMSDVWHLSASCRSWRSMTSGLCSWRSKCWRTSATSSRISGRAAPPPLWWTFSDDQSVWLPPMATCTSHCSSCTSAGISSMHHSFRWPRNWPIKN